MCFYFVVTAFSHLCLEGISPHLPPKETGGLAIQGSPLALVGWTGEGCGSHIGPSWKLVQPAHAAPPPEFSALYVPFPRGPSQGEGGIWKGEVHQEKSRLASCQQGGSAPSLEINPVSPFFWLPRDPLPSTGHLMSCHKSVNFGKFLQSWLEAALGGSQRYPPCSTPKPKLCLYLFYS